MKWINEPDGFYTNQLLGITKEELIVLQSIVKKQRSRVQKLYDKYKDLHESGDATELQQNKMMFYEEELSIIDAFLAK